MGKGRREKKVKQNIDFSKMFGNAIDQMQDLGKNMFRINAHNAKDFKEYIKRMMSMLVDGEESIHSLGVGGFDQVVALCEKMGAEEQTDLNTLNNLYEEFRESEFFVSFIHKMNLLPPESIPPSFLDIFKHYTSFFSKSTQIKQMIKQLLKNIVPPGASHQNFKEALGILDDLGDYFDNNCQKYYMNFIASKNNSGLMVQNIIEDITKICEGGTGSKGVLENISQTDKKKEDKIISSLMKIIELIRLKYPQIQNKLDPFYEQIKNIVNIMETSSTSHPSPDEENKEDSVSMEEEKEKKD